ncbi:hypothetical protein INH39_32125 [Massilia violaceinigra]|uniref:Uncharacterized protein n=1 Tax=Massilia violaceinigra TaxID=2045208 RepID=A0ABY4A5L4_9BURK|nr:cytochrome P460 family protein [Massilia violaceinigra]UOD29952.1 hypothetical protein INH39_32125 [Massilia violaceinigra]
MAASKLNPGVSQFPNGTVIAKLLFTTAPDSEVPYLKNTFEWRANIHVFNGVTCPNGALVRQRQAVRLIQIDLAVKDAPRWFANYPGSRAFDAGAIPTDYSLQIAMGIQNLNRSRTPVRSAANKDPSPLVIGAEDVKLMNRAFDSGRDIPLPIVIGKNLEYPFGR